MPPDASNSNFLSFWYKCRHRLRFSELAMDHLQAYLFPNGKVWDPTMGEHWSIKNRSISEVELKAITTKEIRRFKSNFGSQARDGAIWKTCKLDSNCGRVLCLFAHTGESKESCLKRLGVWNKPFKTEKIRKWWNENFFRDMIFLSLKRDLKAFQDGPDLLPWEEKKTSNNSNDATKELKGAGSNYQVVSERSFVISTLQSVVPVRDLATMIFDYGFTYCPFGNIARVQFTIKKEAVINCQHCDARHTSPESLFTCDGNCHCLPGMIYHGGSEAMLDVWPSVCHNCKNRLFVKPWVNCTRLLVNWHYCTSTPHLILSHRQCHLIDEIFYVFFELLTLLLSRQIIIRCSHINFCNIQSNWERSYQQEDFYYVSR